MSAFPQNVVDELAAYFKDEALDGVKVIVKRQIDPKDNDGTLAIVVDDWEPIEHNIGQNDPMLCRYPMRIQFLTKHAEEQEGRALHSVVSKTIRVMLYRDNSLQIRLRSLNESLFGLTEKVTRIGVFRQRFTSTEFRGTFLFVSVIEMYVETETV